MDGRTGLVVVCLVAGGAWALLVLALLVGRARHRRRTRPLAIVTEVGEWKQPPAVTELARPRRRRTGARPKRCSTSHCGATIPELRTASVTALAGLADRHDWAIDGLVEALAEASREPGPRRRRARPARAAARPTPAAAPRASEPRRPLLRRPPALALSRARRAARPCLHVGSVAERPRRRARDAPGGAARPLRSDTRSGFSTIRIRRCGRRHAARLPQSPAARRLPYLVPLLADTSWWVREAAREALVAAGEHATVAAVEPALESDDPALRSGAALVLQDIGHVDALVGDDEGGRLERIYGAGGRRLRGAAAERARRGLVLGDGAERSRQRPPRELRDSASSRCPDVRCLPGGALAHALGPARSRARGDTGAAGASARSTTSTLCQAPASRPASASSCRHTTRARRSSGRGSLGARDRLPGVRGDRRQRRLDGRHARAARPRARPRPRRGVLDERCSTPSRSSATTARPPIAGSSSSTR